MGGGSPPGKEPGADEGPRSRPINPLRETHMRFGNILTATAFLLIATSAGAAGLKPGNDSYSQGTSLSDAQIQSIVAAGNPTDTNGVYFVLTSADVTASSGFCTQYCGWHTHGTINGRDIKYSFVGNPDRCPSSCAAQTTSPNGNAGAAGRDAIHAH